jgi:hypothetical protein
MRNADYLALISATVVSSIRLLKPHSLWLRNEWGTAPHHFAFIRATVVQHTIAEAPLIVAPAGRLKRP